MVHFVNGISNPALPRISRAFTKEWTDREFKAFAADKTGFDSLGGGASEDPALRESTRQALLNGDLILNLNRGGKTEDFLMARQLEQASTFADILADKKWHLIESDCSRVFMTSDHPVVLLPSQHHRPGMRVGNVDGWVKSFKPHSRTIGRQTKFSCVLVYAVTSKKKPNA